MPKSDCDGCMAVVISKGKHYDEKVVIQYASLTGDSYYVRSLKKLPMIKRFKYDRQGRVRATIAPEERFVVRKTSVRKIEGKAPTLVNMWQPETGKLLTENSGKTRVQIKKKYG